MNNANMNFRIYEAGFILGEYATLKAARAALAAMKLYGECSGYVQRYIGDGEWSRVRTVSK